MKTLFAISVSALLLLTAGVALANSENVNDGSWASGIFAVNVIWPPVSHAVSVIWRPVLFTFAIVGFGMLAIQRLYRKTE